MSALAAAEVDLQIKVDLTLSNESGVEILRKGFQSLEEFVQFNRTYLTSYKGYGLFSFALYPLRTEDVLSDLIFPTLVHQAFKTKTLGRRILGTIAALLFDLATLLPRVALAPFRCRYKQGAVRPKHPLFEIITDPQAQEALRTDWISKVVVFESNLVIKRQSQVTGSSFTGDVTDVTTVVQTLIADERLAAPLVDSSEVHHSAFYFLSSENGLDQSRMTEFSPEVVTVCSKQKFNIW